MVELKRYPALDPAGKRQLVTIASGPVVIRDGKVLLDKHGDDDFWKFPGGKARDDESFEETACREAREELGIGVVLFGEPFIVTFTRQREGLTETVILFHYRASTDDEPKKQRDVRAFDWHDMDQLPEDCAPNVKAAVEAFRDQN